MVKFNKKGFMMAELVVVGAVVLVTLGGMYTSFNKIYSIYSSRLTYYDVSTLYGLAYYRDIFISDGSLVEIMKKLEYDGYNLGDYDEDKYVDHVYVVKINDKKNAVNREMFKNEVVKETFKDYVDYLGKSVDFSEFNYMMIIERCQKKGNVEDINNCTYAYLEVFEKNTEVKE